MSVFERLYHSNDRGYVSPKGWTLHYWKPSEVGYSEPKLYGVIPLSKPQLVTPYIEKAMALGLMLELEVGTWIGETTRREQEVLEADPFIRPLLGANAKDENGHYNGFLLASKAYPLYARHMPEADAIYRKWLELEEHPLVKAYAAEVGVFLCSLGMMRLYGGESLLEMSTQINTDEVRHVRTNGSLLFACGYNPLGLSPSVRALVMETLDWLFDGFAVPEDRMNKDRVMEFSKQFLDEGSCPTLDSMTQVSTEYMPFEVSNSRTYSRSEYEYWSEQGTEDS